MDSVAYYIVMDIVTDMVIGYDIVIGYSDDGWI